MEVLYNDSNLGTDASAYPPVYSPLRVRVTTGVPVLAEDLAHPVHPLSVSGAVSCLG